MNGDGYADLVYVRNNRWSVRFGSSQFATRYTTEEQLANQGTGKKAFAQTIDFNGDGRRDLLVADSANHNWFILSYVPSQVSSSVCTDVPGDPLLCESHTTSLNYTLVDTQRRAHGFEGEAFIADVDGDGLEDIVYMRDGRLKWYKNLSATAGSLPFSTERDLGSVGNPSDPDAPATPGPLPQLQLDVYSPDMRSSALLDINGDGRTDILVKLAHTYWVPDTTSPQCQMEEHSVPIEPAALSRNATVSSTNSVPATLQNIRCGFWETAQNIYLYTSTGEAMVHANVLSGYEDVRVADLNGDGYSDILYRVQNRWYYRLSDGNNFMPPKQTNLPTMANHLVHLAYFLDLNGDGRTDVLFPTSETNWDIYLSRPTDNAARVVFEKRGSKMFSHNAAIQFADIDADGKLDLLQALNDTGWMITKHNRPELNDYVINEITTGWGVSTQIEYSNINQPDVYFREHPNVDHNEAFSPKSGMYVVSRVRSEVNTNSTVSVKYQYGGVGA